MRLPSTGRGTWRSRWLTRALSRLFSIATSGVSRCTDSGGAPQGNALEIAAHAFAAHFASVPPMADVAAKCTEVERTRWAPVADARRLSWGSCSSACSCARSTMPWPPLTRSGLSRDGDLSAVGDAGLSEHVRTLRVVLRRQVVNDTVIDSILHKCPQLPRAADGPHDCTRSSQLSARAASTGCCAAVLTQPTYCASSFERVRVNFACSWCRCCHRGVHRIQGPPFYHWR